MSYLQIYQEKIYDLLNNATSNKIDLTIREHPEKGLWRTLHLHFLEYQINSS